MADQISIITPIYNADKYLSEAVDSVLRQSFEQWELLLINDGSSDRSAEIAQSYDDPRIHYFKQDNAGVSAARNLGLSKMKGDYFCFLDADDVLTENSLSSRLTIFDQSPDNVCFVDGNVSKRSFDLRKELSRWKPSFKGNPLVDLIKLTGHSFFGPSWMIKRDKKKEYRFKEGLTHGEDLLFYADLARDPNAMYDFTEDLVLNYRVHSNSAMQGSLRQLELGYHNICEELRTWPEVSEELAGQFKRKTQKIMVKSYLNHGQLYNAVRALL
ncbi:glycosyltransferase family 2 protein [Ekhidna sp.]|jgi:glycosyltransferase involved in cell wall biosynthesis|uniref:glycosyltransferase family 2 protein n=1 Tax=Ekhidna sp. TaxID=2608089 RepID=UPI0032EC5236